MLSNMLEETFIKKMSQKYLFLFFTALFLFSCAMPEKSFKDTRFLLGTVCEITVISPNKQTAEKAIENAYKKIELIERICGYKPDSEVSKINANSGKQPVKVSPKIIEVIELAIKTGDLTNGAFDITIAPVISLWGFKKEIQRVPSTSEIKKVLPLVNYKNIVIDKTRSAVFLPRPGMAIDLGGIAKGYALRQAMNVLKNCGIKQAMINLGGDIEVIGGRGNNKPWRIGVQHPRKPNELVTVLEYKDKIVATSGDYHRYFVKQSKRYHHIMNPKTGYPTRNDCISVTLITNNRDSAVTSAGIFVLGPENGMKLVESIPDTEAIIITENKNEQKILLSSGLKNKKIKLSY